VIECYFIRMADIRTKGIILRKTNFGDNDVIFDLLNDEGKIIGFFARGARKMKSKFSGVLQLGHIVRLEYATGKNLNYPNEISIDQENLYSFYSKSIATMNFYTDLISITRAVAKDLEDERLFYCITYAFSQAENGEDITELYNTFLERILEMIGVDTSLKCYFSGSLIREEEFYYQPDTNKVISKERKPKTIDLPLITSDKVFLKGYLKKLVFEHVNHKMVLKF
jgi:DNA repair protein RecO